MEVDGDEGGRRKKLLLWDDSEQKAVDMPHAMQEWITSYTTIQVDS